MLISAGQLNWKAPFLLLDKSTGDPITGASPTVEFQYGTNVYAAAGGSVEELGGGGYQYIGLDTEALAGSIKITHADALTQIIPIEVINGDDITQALLTVQVDGEFNLRGLLQLMAGVLYGKS